MGNKKCFFGIIGTVLILGAAIAAVAVYFNEIEDFLSNLKYRVDEKLCSLSKRTKSIDEDEFSDFADI